MSFVLFTIYVILCEEYLKTISEKTIFKDSDEDFLTTFRTQNSEKVSSGTKEKCILKSPESKNFKIPKWLL